MSRHSDDDPRFHFSGVDEQGRPLHTPILPEELGRRFLETPADWTVPEDEDRDVENPTRAPKYGVDVNDLRDAGWAVVFAAGSDPRVRRALEPLLTLRERQARHRYKELVYLGRQDRPEALDDFLARIKANRGAADPDRLPYYVLLVGSPEEVPFAFQYELDLVYAVGRICFDRIEDYDAYARSVVDAEERRVRRRRELTFFAPEHPGDRATRRTHRDLVAPLAEQVAGLEAARGWKVERHLGDDADKATLTGLLDGSRTPALLFTAGHGMASFPGGPTQYTNQGALVTADWKGRELDGALLPQHRFTGSDLRAEASPAGLVAFLFACYGAGTPREDGFFPHPWPAAHIAPQPFVSHLAKRLLSRHRGGALAVLGHVDRAWTTSFDWSGDARQREVFATVLEALLAGLPVGAAMEYLGQLTGDLALQLNQQWEGEHQRRGAPPVRDLGARQRQDDDLRRFAHLRVAHNDARSFVVFGDPAVRLAVL